MFCIVGNFDSADMILRVRAQISWYLMKGLSTLPRAWMIYIQVRLVIKTTREAIFRTSQSSPNADHLDFFIVDWDISRRRDSGYEASLSNSSPVSICMIEFTYLKLICLVVAPRISLIPLVKLVSDSISCSMGDLYCSVRSKVLFKGNSN